MMVMSEKRATRDEQLQALRRHTLGGTPSGGTRGSLSAGLGRSALGGVTTCSVEPTLDAEGEAEYGDRILPNYKKKRMLGRGACAVVWLATKNGSNTAVAMKQVAKGQSAKHRADEEAARSEIAFGDFFFDPGGVPKLSATDYPGVQHIVRLLDVAETSKDLWLVQEFGGDTLTKRLFEIKGEFVGSERLYRVHHLPFYEAMKGDLRLLKHFLRQVLEALLVLSDHEVVHSDLKPENILVEGGENGEVTKSRARLCDFGSAFSFDRNAKPALATPEYMPPEALETCATSRSSMSRTSVRSLTSASFKQNQNAATLSSRAEPWSFDVWSLGAILLEVCHGAPLWLSYKCRVVSNRRDYRIQGLLATPGRDPGKILQRQRELTKEGGLRRALRDTPGIMLDEEGMDLLEGMLCWDPQSRISPEEALTHPFLME